MTCRRPWLPGTPCAGEVARYLEAIRLVAAAVGGYEPLTRAKYLAATLPLSRVVALPGATAVTFVVPATDGIAAT